MKWRKVRILLFKHLLLLYAAAFLVTCTGMLVKNAIFCNGKLCKHLKVGETELRSLWDL